MSRRKTNARLRDPITVRSTSSGLLTYYYYSFGLFWIIFYPFPIIKLSPFYLITSPVPTCLVHNCEVSRRLFYSHLLSPLSQDQIPFDPHHRNHCFETQQPWRGGKCKGTPHIWLRSAPLLPPNIISLCSPWLPKNGMQGHFSIYCRLFSPGASSNSLRNLLEVSCNILHIII